MSLIALCGSRLSGSGSIIPHESRTVEDFLALVLAIPLVILSLVLVWPSSVSAQTNAELSGLGSTGPDLQQLVTATSQIEEQIRALNRALEQDREQAKLAAARDAAALSNGLATLEEALSAQQARQLESWQNSSRAMEHSNRVMLLAAGAVAGIGFLALLVVTWFQWRTTNQLAGLSTAWPLRPALGPGSLVAALGPAEHHATAPDTVHSANARLLGALDQLDQRLRELKGAITSGGNGGAGGEPLSPAAAGRIPALLSRANALLNSDNAEAALACFEEVLALAPNHTEALVKKGAVLERMHKLNEAIECYDRAIAADSSMTFAYLHKGGLCSRLERFKEALECYEKALRTHEQRGN